eukprot:6190918-Pleurochrysis_carterae.AAC.1
MKLQFSVCGSNFAVSACIVYESDEVQDCRLYAYIELRADTTAYRLTCLSISEPDTVSQYMELTVLANTYSVRAVSVTYDN